MEGKTISGINDNFEQIKAGEWFLAFLVSSVLVIGIAILLLLSVLSA